MIITAIFTSARTQSHNSASTAGAQSRRHSTQIALILLFITLVLMWMVNVSDLSFSVPHIKKLSGGAGIPDLLFSYTPSDLYRMLDALTPAGRQAYTHLLIYFDFFFPVMYSLSFSTLIAVLYRQSSWLSVLRKVPYLAGIFDWIENICILTTLLCFPKFVSIAAFASYATTIKYCITVISLFLLGFGILQRGFRMLRP